MEQFLNPNMQKKSFKMFLPLYRQVHQAKTTWWEMIVFLFK